VAELDEVVRSGLVAFAGDIRTSQWSGRREREAVSYFAFRHLVPLCVEETVLFDPAQIAVEVAVPQISGDAAMKLSGRSSAKKQVCKDLVLWPAPGMTCWDSSGRPAQHPMAILEWKFGGKTVDKDDIAWLSEYSSGRSGFVGSAVQVVRQPSDHVILVARVHLGAVQAEWLKM
jgi:hypothetical protein